MDHFVSVVKEEEDAPSMIVSDSSLVSGHQASSELTDQPAGSQQQAHQREVSGVNMDDFMLEIKEENEIKIEEEDMAAVVLTEDPLATHHQEASWKEITSKPK
ncbi:hypothetical protein GWK47_047244 [Chionoecetes opilio]|uniref:Uncharacterized protein n=1 Tax=Chionoecetes opilio TaxID=41210 RepID=A0A8J4Y6G5_CHIOP|nr:hypothetical protein GWK47_047244 [Chionoecetes opilio]